MLLSRFRNDRRGSVAPMFALAVVPMIGLVGAAVDYSRAAGLRTQMQAAIDATALMLSKDAPTMSASQLEKNANAYFQAQFARPEARNVKISVSFSQLAGSTLKISGSGSFDTNFMGLLGFPTLDFASSSTVRWGSTKLQVALALDNTGSMASAGKMTALKTATHQLLDILKGAASQPNDVNVAIIPFAREVNVGKSNYNASWIDWSDWEDDNGSYVESKSCTSTRKGKNKCTSTTTWQPAPHNTWNGCIADRDQDYDTKNTAPNPSDANLPPTSASTLFPAQQSPWCPAAMQPLTNQWSTLNGLVDLMVPSGNTNQGIGLAWAWQALTQGQPMNAPGKPADTQQIIILFTDGLNTQNRWYTSQAQIDARQKITCDNIKAAGITLYTVQVNTDGDPTSTLLQQCASDSGKFFLLKSASQIATAFNQIGTEISKLRISN